jgi:hypothetical protein
VLPAMYPGGWDGWGESILTIATGLDILLRKSQHSCVMCNQTTLLMVAPAAL